MFSSIQKLLGDGPVALTFKAEADGKVRIGFTHRVESPKVAVPAFGFVTDWSTAAADLEKALSTLSAHRSTHVDAVLAEAKKVMDEAAAAEKAAADEKLAKAKASAKKPGTSIVKPAKTSGAPSFDDDDDDGSDEKVSAPSATAAAAPAAAEPSLFD